MKIKILFLALIILFVGDILHGVFQYSKAVSTSNWTLVKGSVFKSEIITISSSIGTKGTINENQISIGYSYQVKGKNHLSNIYAIGYDDSNYSKVQKQNIVKDHSKGELIDIFYNSEEPSESVLVKGTSYLSDVWVSIFIEILLVILMIFIYKKYIAGKNNEE